jgi:GAF domain-containing protein
VALIVGAWARAGTARALPVGTRVELGGRNVHTLVFHTGRPARIDDYTEASGVAADVTRRLAGRSGVGVPIGVEGRLWGLMYVASRHEQPLSADTKDQLARFTELVATAVADAQARTELRGFADEQAALRRVATLAGHLRTTARPVVRAAGRSAGPRRGAARRSQPRPGGPRQYRSAAHRWPRWP